MGRWEPYLSLGLRAVKAASDFTLTLIVALALFTATAIEAPIFMRDLLTLVKEFRNYIALHRGDTAMLWADIFLQPPLIIFIVFAMATRLLFEGIYAIFNRGQFPAEPASAASESAASPFSQW
jgi:hypothetical protein